MANTGNLLPSVGANVDRAGLTAWTNPGNIVSDNATDATCSGAGSDYLVARGFDFSSIPDNATIVGVLVRVEASEHSSGTEALLAQLQDAAGALFGSSKSTSNQGSISGTAKAVYTYGSTSDLWGATLTPAIVKDADFGVRLWFATSHDVRIDFVTMAIEYTTPPPISGSASVTADDATVAGTGVLPVVGQASPTLEDATVAATGTGPVAIAGALAVTLEDATAAGTATLAIAGSATASLADATAAGTGVLPITGSASLTTDDAVLQATAVLVIAGVAAAILEDAGVSAAAALPIAGLATPALDDATVVAAGGGPNTGVVDAVLEDASLLATAYIGDQPAPSPPAASVGHRRGKAQRRRLPFAFSVTNAPLGIPSSPARKVKPRVVVLDVLLEDAVISASGSLRRRSARRRVAAGKVAVATDDAVLVAHGIRTWDAVIAEDDALLLLAPPVQALAAARPVYNPSRPDSGGP